LDDTTNPMVDALKSICIYMHVGAQDNDWMLAMKQQSDMFRRKGLSAELLVEEDQGHSLVFGQEDISQLFDDLDRAAKGCGK
jgi:hypothetical protein